MSDINREAALEHIQGVLDHKELVGVFLNAIITDMVRRAIVHDYSKYTPEEFDSFVEATPQLKTLTYGSEEYRTALRKIKPAIKHHYEVNDHHPEHYENGINQMNLLEVVEMVCDWLAATKRVKDGDIFKSLEINKERFGIGDQLYTIIRNTVIFLTSGKE